MADDPKVKFDNKREMDAAAFSQAAYVLDQARQNLGEGEACEKARMLRRAKMNYQMN